MAELIRFPMLSQLTDANEVNREFDCVPTSLAAGLEWLTGKSYTGAIVKDAVYGRAYVGGTSAYAYVPYCQAQGVDVLPINEGDTVRLVGRVVGELELQHPVVATEPDPYSTEPGMSHVIIFYKADNGVLTAMDPFLAGPIARTFTEWATILLFNQVWTMSLIVKKEQPMQPIAATDDDRQVWQLLRKDVPLVATHGIPQSWLQGRWTRGMNFGPVLENEHAITRGNSQLIEQQFTAGRAVWNPTTGKCMWYTATGPVQV